MDDLIGKIKALKIDVLAESIWKEDINKLSIEKWLNNFETETEKELVLKLLSQFMYFNVKEIRTCLNTMYEDLYKTPIIQEYRKETNSFNLEEYTNFFNHELKKTRFVLLGNPSESSSLLLYFFRQENSLRKDLFCSLSEIKTIHEDIERVIIIDDLTASGSQAIKFIKENVNDLKKDKIKFSYYVLFATTEAIDEIMKTIKSLEIISFELKFIFKLDNTFKVCNEKSKYIDNKEEITLLKENSETFYYDKFDFDYKEYGLKDKDSLKKYLKSCGFKDSQLLLGFFYNIPNNTIPIIWAESDEWTPIFKRYEKVYR
ncbi:hypothetical protein [Poseidonibacter lekithochrous]|uniref:phosphoribosyltransferase-like protein n=1 Tax=Poseidonibacter lekithochrous TaxID=1904463 RepID=UPI0008FC6E79|nr:hypothetical protein [Poseidonibacter lekithochrous]QKJ22166.1 hypothetical protein ALEK_0884 [Poseidonibacter lekithochrous]